MELIANIEPSSVRTYNYESGALEEIIDYDISDKLQKQLEGSVR